MTESTVTTFHRRFSVGRFQCEFTAQLIGNEPVLTQVEWTPYAPKRLSPVLFKEYRRKRNRVYVSLAERVGGPVIVVDRDGAIAAYPDGKIETLWQEETRA